MWTQWTWALFLTLIWFHLLCRFCRTLLIHKVTRLPSASLTFPIDVESNLLALAQPCLSSPGPGVLLPVSFKTLLMWKVAPHVAYHSLTPAESCRCRNQPVTSVTFSFYIGSRGKKWWKEPIIYHSTFEHFIQFYFSSITGTVVSILSSSRHFTTYDNSLGRYVPWYSIF